jgi:hypothetical protein
LNIFHSQHLLAKMPSYFLLLYPIYTHKGASARVETEYLSTSYNVYQIFNKFNEYNNAQLQKRYCISNPAKVRIPIKLGTSCQLKWRGVADCCGESYLTVNAQGGHGVWEWCIRNGRVSRGLSRNEYVSWISSLHCHLC